MQRVGIVVLLVAVAAVGTYFLLKAPDAGQAQSPLNSPTAAENERNSGSGLLHEQEWIDAAPSPSESEDEAPEVAVAVAPSRDPAQQTLREALAPRQNARSAPRPQLSRPDLRLSEHSALPAGPPDPDQAEPPPGDTEEAVAFRNSIRDGFRDVRTEIRDCYEDLLEFNPELSDRIVAELRIVPDPDDPEWSIVELTAVEAGNMDIEDTECFALAFETIGIPAPPNGDAETVIRYPVVLTSSP